MSDEQAADGGRALVLVLGPGRSGTSTMAGALAASGYHVPNAIKPNERNPRGFFEPRWVVNLHKRTLRDLDVGTLDSDPRALDVVRRRTLTPEFRDELRAWLSARFERHPRLVIKDPRLIWFRDVWAEVARDLGVEPRFVVMLRHPSEVTASRATYYSARDVNAVSGWINVALTAEQLTAASPRRIVSYPDLLADWRHELTRLRDDLAVPLEPGPETRPHPVDDFIDPSLRRMASGWDDVAAPDYLTGLAERVHAALLESAVDGDSAELSARVQALREEYDVLYQAARSMVRKEAERRENRIRRRVRARVRERVTRELQAADPRASSLPRRLRRAAGRLAHRS